MTTAISIITLVIVFIIWLILNGLYKLFKDLNRKIDSLKFRIENPDIKDQIVIKRNYEKN